jgi:predicted kinase
MKELAKIDLVLVMVMGLPGSGKSYFAKKLASEIDAEYLGSDEIRKDLGLMGRYELAVKLSVYEEMFKRAKACHKRGKSVVLDGTFFLQQVRDLVIFLANSLSWKLSIIHIQADEDVIAKRLAKPREDSEADMDVYQKIKSEFEPIQENHLLIKSKDGFVEEDIKKAIDFIYSDYEKERSLSIKGQRYF